MKRTILTAIMASVLIISTKAEDTKAGNDAACAQAKQDARSAIDHASTLNTSEAGKCVNQAVGNAASCVSGGDKVQKGDCNQTRSADSAK